MSRQDRILVAVLAVIAGVLLWLGYGYHERGRSTAGHRLDQEQVR